MPQHIATPRTLAPTRLPRVTARDVRRFADIADIRDTKAFAAELQAFVHERVQALQAPAQTPAHPASLAHHTQSLKQGLAKKAAALRADTRWAPDAADIQRGRALLLQAFDRAHNLPLVEFAKLAGKSRQQIYKDILARRLLALNVGPRGQKLPDWQLDTHKQQLTQAVLTHAPEIDNWTIYRALSEPLEGLGARSPVEVAAPGTVDKAARAALNVLGIHETGFEQASA